MSLDLETWHGLLDWTGGPGLGRLGQAGVGTGLGVLGSCLTIGLRMTLKDKILSGIVNSHLGSF